MNNLAAIIAPAIDVARIAREVAAANIALQDAERAVEGAEKRATSAKAEADKRRLDLGRLLCEARKAWPARGPKAKGWGEFLLTVGLEQQTAREYMSLAGYYEEISKPVEDGLETPIPSRREIAAARRSEPDQVDLPETKDEEVTDYGMEVVADTQPAARTYQRAHEESSSDKRARDKATDGVTSTIKKALSLIKGRNPFDVPLVEVEQCLREALKALKEMR